MNKQLRSNRKLIRLILIGLIMAILGETNLFSQTQYPEGTIHGSFTISNKTTVFFSKGNLQYQASTNTWRFADKQWSYIGNASGNTTGMLGGRDTQSNWIDLFGWGTSGYDHGAVCYQPWNISGQNSDHYAYGDETKNLYDSDWKADWGRNAISNGGNKTNVWYVLSSGQWSYLLFSRSTTSGKRFTKATVAGCKGLILLPDEWNTSTYTLNNYNDSNAAYNGNVITEAQWTTLENAGAVFLPMAGMRTNGIGSWSAEVINDNTHGYYWASNVSSNNRVYELHFGTTSNNSQVLTTAEFYYRYEGLSVRLVRYCTKKTITVLANPTDGGIVTGGGYYYQDTQVTLTATPNTGYRFVNWTKNGVQQSTSRTYTFTMGYYDETYTANFELKTYTIYANASPTAGGSVEGAGTYTHGDECTLTATANPGYTFDCWKESGNVLSTEPSYTFTVTDWGSYQAVFVPSTYTIDVSANPAIGGSVSGGGVYDHNSTCTLHANSATGYHFVNWTKDNVQVSTNNNYSFTVTGAGAYVAHFAKNTYSITATANPSDGGAVSGGGTYEHGSNCTLTATANSGYVFVNWTKNGNVVSSDATYSFNVTAAGSYQANFECIINASANPTAGGTVSGAGNYTYGSSCTLTATANSGCEFVNWTKNGSSVSTDPSYTFTVNAPGNYIANFHYIITATANPTAGGTVGGGGSYTPNTQCTLTATPATGYTFTRWEKNGVQVSTDASYTFNVTEPASYVAVFTINTYTITTTADPAIGGTVTGAGTYEHGSQCTLTATPATGYNFVRWTKNGTSVSTSSSYNINVTEAASYVAVFTPKTYTITVSKTPSINNSSSVSGGGTYSYGSTCTLTATPNTYTHYVFVNWTNNDEEVSINPSYSFTVTENSSYVAHFMQTSPLTYSYNDNNYTATVTGFQTEYNLPPGTLIIPSRVQYNGHNYTVTTIGEQAFWNSTKITGTVTLPSSVTTIEYGAFRGCTEITGLDLANVVTVGDGAFCYCSGLTGTLTIPNTVTSIGIQAFYECTGITAIAVGSAANMQTGLNNPFVGCSAVTNVTVDPNNPYFDSRDNCNAIIKTSNNELIFGCSSGSIPNTVTSIGDYAFWHQTNRSAVYFPTSLVSIGTSAFSGCTNLFKNIIFDLTIPNGVITIGDEAFYNCPNLIGTLTIPNSVTTIGNNAFGCESSTTRITTLNIGSGVTNIGYNAFLNRRFTSINVDAITPPTIESPGAFINITTTIPVAVPCGTLSDYQVAYGWSSFTNMQDGSFVINASVNQASYGTVSGAGRYCSGEDCTLTATPATYYRFVNWTEGGNVVSTDASYTFTVTGDRTLVANFELDGIHFITAGNWNDASNWLPSTVPGTNDNVIINAAATIPSNYLAQVANVTIGTGGSITVEDGGQLKCNNAVTATFIKNIAACPADNSAQNWYLITSPVGQVNTSVVTTGHSYNLFKYNEADVTWDGNGGAYAFTTLNTGVGYLYRKADATPLQFTGSIIKDNPSNPLEITLTRKSDAELQGFNLIGNPYSHNIQSNCISLTGGATFSGVYTLSTAGEWIAATATDIKPCEGFLVQVPTGITSTTATFTEPSKGTTYKNDYIRFNVTNNQNEDVAIALFNDSEGMDKLNHRNSEAPMLYITQNNHDYAIATMSDDTKLFNLSFKTATMGQYTLCYKANGEFNYLHIIDRLTGIDTDMLLDGKYTFVAYPNDNANRFIVKLGYIPDYSDGDNDIFAYQNGSEILVSGEGELQIFDIAGRKVSTMNINGAETIRLSAQGVYIFRLIGTEVKTQKIVVR